MTLDGIQYFLVLAFFLAVTFTAVALSWAFPKKRGAPYEMWRWMVIVTIAVTVTLFVVTLSRFAAGA